MEDMGNNPARDGSVTCSHPPIGNSDPTTAAASSDGYTTRHDPFVYFHSIIDDTSECSQNVVPMGDTAGSMPAGARPGDRAGDRPAVVATTPNLSFITPTCATTAMTTRAPTPTGAGQGGGSAVGDIDKWLKTWVPIITWSPAFRQDGLLEITFDEAEDPSVDATACCGETPGPAASSGPTAALDRAEVWSGRCRCRPSSPGTRW